MAERNVLPLADFYQGRILNFAHRGARERAPENTIPAFVSAADLGADGVELDVHLSADGVVVVMHDADVATTTDGTGRITGMDLAEIKLLDAGSSFDPSFAGTVVPTLDEVFEAVAGRLLFNIELKTVALGTRGYNRLLAHAVALCLEHHNLVDQTICSSFNPFVLRALRIRLPRLALGYLYAPDLPAPLAKGWLARPIIGKHEARHPHYSMVEEGYVHWARKHAYRINVWTVNEIEDIRRMRDLSVDALISDRPELVREVLQG
jgi:glycerophosphoryl diester phosphodiesterase